MVILRLRRAAFKYIFLVCIIGFQGLCMQGKVTKSVFGTMPDGTKIYIFTLQEGAMQARIITYGARLVSLDVPDRNDKTADVVLGYDSLTPYTTDSKTYFGAIVGRYANRIGRGTFVLDGKRYDLPKNDGDNTLHGGTVGFDKRVWSAHEIPHGVELTLVSKNGTAASRDTTTRVSYTLRAHALRIEYFATTDADTVLNLTNHSYFNLSGEGQGNILNDVLTIPAESYTPVNAGLIPTGQLAAVAGTPFDFRTPTPVGKRIDENNEQLRFAKGYDMNFVLKPRPRSSVAPRGCPRVGPQDWARPACENQPTRRPTLFRKFPRRNNPWKARACLREARRIMSGNETFPGFSQ